MRLAALALLVFAMACDSLAGPEPTGPEPVALTGPTERWAGHHACSADSPAPSVSPLRLSVLPPPIEDSDTELAARTRSVPGGFGGFFLDGYQAFIYLKDPGRERAAVPQLLEMHAITRAPNVVLEGRWSFAQLYDWRWYLEMRVGRDWYTMDIDETRNHITFGFLKEEERSAFERRLLELDVPCFLVVTELTSPIVPR